MALAAFLAMIAGFIAIVVWSVRYNARHEREQHEARAQRARQRGWQYEPKPTPKLDYRFSGQHQGVHWTLEFESDGEGAGHAVWRTHSIPSTQPALLIVNSTIDKVMQGPVGKWLGRTIATTPEKAKHGLGLYSLPHRVDTGSEEFRRRFTARAQDPTLPRRVIDHDVQQSMLRLLALSVAYSEQGLQIECGSQLTNPDQLEEVIRLGTHLAHKLR